MTHERQSSLRRRRAQRSQAGTTLLEIMVVVSLLSIVLGAAYGALASVQRTQATTTDRFSALNQAQVLIDRISRDLRTAVSPTPTGQAFASADTQDVTFYASLADPNGPTKLHAFLINLPSLHVAAMREDQTAPDANSAPNYSYTGTASIRVNGQYIDTNAPIFTYYDRNGTLIPTPITSPTALGSIDIVGITLTTRIRPTAPPVTVTTKVHVRNVDYNPT